MTANFALHGWWRTS
ncbi:trp operon leader peptide [Enterobacter hormaechei]|nr:trp operon leader peptide [Enterobacter hormaechei]MBD1275913.1 trp operon leader peptide [Enterobacter hormaechei subsp. xiangfangensis]HAV1841623.1 trp operon leader peptide [Enterobacter hormaechei subsp. xiangfangensis]HCT9982048.1 trp operon leader peptide [Enterobacter hormaechei]